MRKHPFPLAAVAVLAMACASHAAEKPRPPAQNQKRSAKVWTNDDVEQLHARGLISIVGQEPGAEPATAQQAAASETTSFPAYDSRLDDPAWYAQTAADLQAELDQRTADLQQQQEAIAQAKNRVTQAGVALDRPSTGITPEQGLANLQARVQEIQDQLDELAELARLHDIPPGDLRS